MRECKQENEFKGHTGIINSIKFIESKWLLVLAGNDRMLGVWKLGDKTEYEVFRGHSNIVWKVFVTEDKRFII